jgi:hypothetical protein
MGKRGRPPNDDVEDDVRAVVALLRVNDQPDHPQKDDRVRAVAKKSGKSPRTIYSLLQHYEDNEEGWSRSFIKPISAPKIRSRRRTGNKILTLRTLRDADLYIRNEVPTIKQEREEWRAAAQELKKVIDSGGSTMAAYVAINNAVEKLNAKNRAFSRI